MKIFFFILFALFHTAPSYAQNKTVFQKYPMEKHTSGYCNYALMHEYLDSITVPRQQHPGLRDSSTCWYGAQSGRIDIQANGDVLYDHKLQDNLFSEGLRSRHKHYFMFNHGDFEINIHISEDNQKDEFIFFFVGGRAILRATNPKGKIYYLGGELEYFLNPYGTWALVESGTWIPRQIEY